MQENSGFQPPSPNQDPNQVPPQPQPQPQPQQQPFQPQQPQEFQPQQHQPVQQFGAPEQSVMGAPMGPVSPSPKSKKPLIIVAIVVAALLVLGGATWAIVSMNSGSSSGGNSGENSGTEAALNTPPDQKEAVTVGTKYELGAVCEGKKASNAGSYTAPYVIDIFSEVDGDWKYVIDAGTPEDPSPSPDVSGTNVVMCMTTDYDSAGTPQACPAGPGNEVSLKPINLDYALYAAQTGELVVQGTMLADACPPEWVFAFGDGESITDYMTWSQSAMQKLRADFPNIN